MSQHRLTPQCTEFSCPLKSSCSKVDCIVYMHEFASDDRVDVLLVGDAPSGKDFLKRLPFQGFESNVITEALKLYGEGLDLSVGMSMVVRGWSYDASTVPEYMKNRTPYQFAEKYIHKIHNKSFNTIPKHVVNTCLQFLNADIAKLKPKVIIAMGNSVATALFPNEQRSISNLYNDLSLTYMGFPVRFISSPSAVLRNPSLKQSWMNQFCNILHKKGQKYSVELGESRILGTLKEALDYLAYLKNFAGAVAVDTETRCLRKGTLTLTNRGLVPIEQVTTNDKVYNGTEFISVKDLYKKRGNVWQLTTGRGFVYGVSEDHKFEVYNKHTLDMTFENTETIKNNIDKYYIPLRRNIKVAVDPVIINFVEDYLSFAESQPLTCQQCGGLYHDLVQHYKHKHKMTREQYLGLELHSEKKRRKIANTQAKYWGTKPLKYPTVMDEKLAWWLGCLISEGGSSTTMKYGQISFSQKKLPEYFDEYCNVTNELFGVLPNIIKARTGCWTATCGAYVRQFAEFCGYVSGANNKEIPWSVLSSSQSIQTAFLRAVFSGDGSAPNAKVRVITYASKSRLLVSQMQQLLLLNGVVSHAGKKWSKKYGCYYYRNTITGNDVDQYFDVIGQSHNIVKRKLSQPFVRPTIKNIVPNLKEVLQEIKHKHNVKFYFGDSIKNASVVTWSQFDAQFHRICYFLKELGEIEILSRLEKLYNLRPYLEEIAAVECLGVVEELHDLVLDEKTPWFVANGSLQFDCLNKRYGNTLGSAQFATDSKVGYFLPYNHPESPFTPEELEQLKKAMYDLFRNPCKIKSWIAHNAKFECNIFAQVIGTQLLSAPIFDTQVGAFILDENRLERVAEFKYGPYSLKQLALDYLGFDGYDKETLKVREEGNLMDLPLEQLVPYANMDAYTTYGLRNALLVEAKKQNYTEQFLNLMYYQFTPVINLFCDIEQGGMPVNIEHVRSLLKKDSVILQEINRIEKELRESPETIRANEVLVQKTVTGGSSLKVTPLMGTPWIFDFARTGHPQVLFYDVMNLPKGKAGKTGYSVDEEWQTMNKGNKLVDDYSEWVLLRKMFDSFVTKLYAYVDPSGNNVDCKTDCRIRPNYQVSGVVTGRIACKSPNMQAIPRAENASKKAIKNIFQAPQGQIMIQADYKANEIRWVAIAAKDDKMADNFNQGKYWIDQYKINPTEENLKKAELHDDVHRQNAAKAFQKPLESITKDERQKAKGLNFGLLYDSTEEAISELYKIELEDVRRMFENFYKEYDDILAWKKEMKQCAQDRSYVEAPQGRRRRFPVFDLWRDRDGLFNMDYVPREFRGGVGDALRQASNAPIQGIASDSGMIGAWLVSKYIRDNNKNWTMCNAVHDSLVLTMPYEDFSVKHLQDIEDCMSIKNMEYMNAVWGIEFNLPIGVDIEYGLKWGDMKKILPVEKELEAAKKYLEEKMAR